jgi:hypothetical protein
VGPAWQREKRREGARAGERGEVGPASWAAWREGRGEGNGLPGERRDWPKGRRGKRAGRAAGLGYLLFFLLLFFFFSTLKLFKQIYLNSMNSNPIHFTQINNAPA